MSRSSIRQVLLRSALVLAACQAAFSQTAEVSGRVTDPSSAVIPGAGIEVLNLDTGVTRRTTSNDQGYYAVPLLPSGNYGITVQKEGFRTVSVSGIRLEVDQTARYDFRLELGAVSEAVSVHGSAGVIATETAQIQGSFDYRRFEEGAWVADGRGPRVFLTTLPQVTSVNGGLYSFRIAGQPDAQVEAGLDGLPNQGSSILGINVQNIDEVVLMTGNNSAEHSRPVFIYYGSKGGGNQLHGRVLYWHQNTALAARSFFDATKPEYLFHTFHGLISGPVRKDKTFFLVDYSGQQWPASTYYLRTLPTERMRQGDFSQLLGLTARVVVKDPTSGTPFAGNVIPASRLNPTAQKVLQQYVPSPNLGDSGTMARNYGFLFPYPADLASTNGIQARIDHQITARNSIFARASYSISPYVLAGSYPQLTATEMRYNLHAVVQDTHVFSPSLVNSSRWGIYRPKRTDGLEVKGVTPLKGDVAVKELGIQGVNPKGLSGQGFPTMSVTGYDSITVAAPTITDQKTWDYMDSLTWARGRHVLKFGAEYRRYSSYSGAIPSGTYGQFTFNGTFTGYGAADLLLGLPYSSYRLDPLTRRTVLGSDLGLYAEDSIKLGNRLTLELGARWERFGAARYEDGLMYNWDPATGNVVIPEAARAAISPLYPTGRINVVTGTVQPTPSLRNLVPRLGTAYRPFGNAFVVRGGYGIFTEVFGPYARAQGEGPFQLGETYYNSVAGGLPLFSLPNPFPTGVAGSIAAQSISGYPLEAKHGRIHQFSLTIEREIAAMGFRMSYMGNRARGLNYSLGINKPEPSLTAFDASRRPYSQFVSVSVVRTNGSSNYNSLTFEVVRKLRDLSFDVHWTWASSYLNTLNLENPYERLLWNRDSDIPRHAFTANANFGLPFGRGKQFLSHLPRPIDQIIGGWRVYWIANMQPGQFFSPSFSGSDPSNTNSTGGLPDRIGNGNLPSSQRRIDRWFDPSAFAVPPKGRFGNSGMNILEGPGLQLHNLSIGKNFRFAERFTCTFMAAAQNVFNHPNFTKPGANISAPASVGVISSTLQISPGRQIMLRGRLEF